MPVYTKESSAPAPHRRRLPALRLPALPKLPLPQGSSQSTLAWQCATAAAGALLGAGQVYGGAAPFGLALVLGCPPHCCLAAALGAVAGALLSLPAHTAFQLAGAVLAAAGVRQLSGKRYGWAAGAAVAALALGQLLAAAYTGFSPAQGLTALGTAALGVGLGAALRQLPARTPRGACLWLMMLVASLQRLPAWGLAPGLAAAALAGLCAAAAGTLEDSAVLSVALAVAFTAASPSLCYAALAVALGTLAAACLCPGERLRCAAAFAGGCALGALATPSPALLLPLAGGAATGILLFLLLPEAALHALFPPREVPPPVHSPVASATARRLDAVAQALSDVADTVNAVCERGLPPRGESFDFVVEYTARRLCQACPRREGCWLQNYSDTVDGLYHLKPALESRGSLRIEDLDGALTGCAHPARLCETAAHGYRLWRSRRQSRAQAALLRAALTEQYTAMAGALAQLAGKLSQAGLPDPRREARAARLFASLGLEALECSVTTDLTGRMDVQVVTPRTAYAPDELAALTAELSRACQRDLALPDVSHCRAVTTLCFAERPLYRACFGAANHPATGQSVSGDAYEQFCDGGGRAQMLLCDGMGAGRPAAVDGRMAARLTAQLLRAGFAAQSAARLVNVALGLKSADRESGATLDLLTVDLYNGRAGLFKAGAAPSFLLRGGVARALEGPGLPIGVLDTVVGRSTSLGLEPGDSLVMVSDGALADGSEWLLQQLTLCARLDHDAGQIARAVADSAVQRQAAAPRRDDVTVIVLRLENA